MPQAHASAFASFLHSHDKQRQTKKMSCEYTQEVVLHLLRWKIYGEDSIYPEDYIPPLILLFSSVRHYF